MWLETITTTTTTTIQIGLIGGGHGYSPIAFSCSTGTWKLAGALETRPEESKKEEKAEASGAASARAMFQKMNQSNQAPGDKKEAVALDNTWKQHQSAITCLLPGGAPSGSPTFPSVSTTGMDGRLVMWDLLKSSVPAATLGL
jgi:hypothetical protein